MSPADAARLGTQIRRVKRAMLDGQYRTFEEIAAITGDPIASISAQLRNLRKAKHGGHTVNRRHEGFGLFKYQLIVNSNG